MSNDKKRRELAKIIAGRMTGNTQQIDAVRSTRGQIKGFFTQDTLYRLRQAVADHEKAGEENALARLGIILGLCDNYLDRHGREKEERAREKVELVEDIQARASAERTRRQAEAIYLQDVYAAARKGGPSDTEFVRATPGAKATAVYQTQSLVQGKLEKNPKEGFNQATLDLIKKYGLTEVEVLAVKIYTADDYKYINPATGNNESRMREYVEPPKKIQLAPQPTDEEESGASQESEGPGSKLAPSGLGQPPPKLVDDETDDAQESEASGPKLPEVPELNFESERSESSAVLSERDEELSEFLGLTFRDDEDLSNALELSPEEEEELSALLEKGKEHEAPEAPEPEGKEHETSEDAGPEEKEDGKPKDYFATAKGRSHIKQLFEEGSLHGAMAIAALKKLPTVGGLVFRGMRLTEKEFHDYYHEPKPYALSALTSVATVRAAAEPFADGEGCTDPNKTVSVMSCLDVKTARDLGDLSVFGRREKEWLLIPGTELVTDSVEELETGNKGDPPATKWVVVMAHEA